MTPNAWSCAGTTHSCASSHLSRDQVTSRGFSSLTKRDHLARCSFLSTGLVVHGGFLVKISIYYIAYTITGRAALTQRNAIPL